MSFIELQNVSFAYKDGHLAVDGISLNIEKGENVAIVGQNGAGKTTTVKLLNGLHRPTKGDVIIDGMNTKNYTTAQLSRKVGYVFQNPDDQIFHSTVYEEVAYGPKMLKLPEKTQNEQILEALKITGLGKYLNENPFNLPLSIRKFVTIASIIAMNCEVFVFDEPTAGQDYVGTQRLAWMIGELQKKGKTIVTITHDMSFVAENFQRVIVLCQKKKLAEGTPAEIFWNKPVWETAMLKQPYVSHLCSCLGIETRAVRMEEVCDILTATARRSMA